VQKSVLVCLSLLLCGVFLIGAGMPRKELILDARQFMPDEEPKILTVKQPSNYSGTDYDDLASMLKELEGNLDVQRKLGYFRDGRFYIYNDVKSNPTVGYGHLVLKSELESGRFRNGLTPDEADALLHEDIRRAESGAKNVLGRDGWKKLDTNRRSMAIDFAFHGGPGLLKRYTKFTYALRNNDWDTMSKEYERHYTDDNTGELVPFTHRNKIFYDKFIAPNYNPQGIIR
jgi:GH24 family phage-related lysozyme (muramidase)